MAPMVHTFATMEPRSHTLDIITLALGASALVLSGCGDSKAGGIFKITKHVANEESCDANAAKAATETTTHLVLAPVGAGWTALGCADVDACKAARQKYDKGEMVDGLAYGAFGAPTEGRYTGGIAWPGKFSAGQCSGVREEVSSLQVSGAAGTLEIQEMEYASFPAADVTACTLVDAKKQKIASTCKAVQRLELTRVE